MEALRRHLGLGPIVQHRHILWRHGGDGACRALSGRGVAPGADRHRGAWRVRPAGAGRSCEERGTASSRRVCETLWEGGFRTADEMRRYYDVMGPLYARTARSGGGRGGAGGGRSTAPEPLNRAFGPTGFLRRFDLRPELGRITAPTLILAGRHDWICPPEFSEEIASADPGSDLRMFEDSSHSIRADEPQAMLDAIVGFLVYR